MSKRLTNWTRRRLSDFEKICPLFIIALFLLSALPAWAGLNQWTSNGGPEGGSIDAIAMSPNYVNDHTLFVACAGIYKSTDGGQSWSRMRGGGYLSPYPRIYSIAISPNYANDATVFVGTGYGAYKTTDGGQSWSRLYGGLPTNFSGGVAVSPNYASDTTVFAIDGYTGIYKSTNGGQSWTLIYSVINTNVWSISVSPNYANDSTIFAASTSNGVYKSTDGGQSWTQMSNGFSYGRIYSLVISPAYVNDSTVFAGSADGLYKSINDGQSWTRINGGNGVDSLDISPNYANDFTVFARMTEGALYKSIDGGQSWSKLTNTYITGLGVSPNYANDSIIFTGTNDSLLKSTDGGESWTEMDSGITDKSPLIIISPDYVNDETVFAISGGIYRSTSRGQNWTKMTATGLTDPSINHVAISPNYVNDATLFAGTLNSGIFKSTDGAQSWTQINTGLTDLDIPFIAISPNYANDNTVFAATYVGVYKSTDGGQTWAAMNTGLTDIIIRAIAISPNYTNDHTLFAATHDAVFKSTDRGQTWILTSNDLAGTDVRVIAISPNYVNDHTLFAGTDLRGPFKSINNGQNWSQIDAYFINGGVSSLAISPNYTNDSTILEAITIYGIYKSINGGQSWTEMNNGLPDMDMASIVFSPSYGTDGTVFAGVARNGVYSYTFSSSHTITASTGPNGTISPSGAIRVDYNGAQSFIIVPNVGYHIADVLVDGSSVGAVISYPFNNVTIDHTISASFALNPDTTPPTAPTNLRSPYNSYSRIDITWDASSDNVGVAGYNIYNGFTDALVASTNQTSYTFNNITPASWYRYYVKAYDAAGNISAQSNMIGVWAMESPVQTPVGTDVPVLISNSTIEMTFSQVTTPGVTSLIRYNTPPGPLPPGYIFMDLLFDFSTTAVFTSPITITISFNDIFAQGHGANMRMFHWENGMWKDVTVSVDLNHRPDYLLIGQVNSLSPFAVGYPAISFGTYSAGANTNIIALFAILATSIGVFLIRKRWRQSHRIG